jgi:hypothetical protein
LPSLPFFIPIANFLISIISCYYIIHYAGGAKYKGIYRNGKRNGAAIEETKDGTRFEGSYVDDRRDGNEKTADTASKNIFKFIYRFVVMLL